MNATRQTQPYRESDSRGPSPVLDTMRAGRAFGDGGGNSLMRAFDASKGKPAKRVRVHPMLLRTPPAQR